MRPRGRDGGGDRINSSGSCQRSSYWLWNRSQRQMSLLRCSCGNFALAQILSFSTQSARSGHSVATHSIPSLLVDGRQALRHVARKSLAYTSIARRRSAATKLGWIIVGRRVVVVGPQATRNRVVAIDPHTTRRGVAWDPSLAGTNHESSR